MQSIGLIYQLLCCKVLALNNSVIYCNEWAQDVHNDLQIRFLVNCCIFMIPETFESIDIPPHLIRRVCCVLWPMIQSKWQYFQRIIHPTSLPAVIPLPIHDAPTTSRLITPKPSIGRGLRCLTCRGVNWKRQKGNTVATLRLLLMADSENRWRAGRAVSGWCEGWC